MRVAAFFDQNHLDSAKGRVPNDDCHFLILLQARQLSCLTENFTILPHQNSSIGEFRNVIRRI